MNDTLHRIAEALERIADSVNPPASEPNDLSVPQVMAKLKCGRAAVISMIRSGTLTGYELRPNTYRVTPRALTEFRNRTAAQSPRKARRKAKANVKKFV